MGKITLKKKLNEQAYLLLQNEDETRIFENSKRKI